MNRYALELGIAVLEGSKKLCLIIFFGYTSKAHTNLEVPVRRAIILVGCVFTLIASSGESSDSFTLSVVGNEKQNVVEAQHSDATVIISNKNRSVVTPPLVEFNQNGDAVAVWQSLDQNNRLVLVGAFYTEEGGWENSQVISELTEKINPGDYKIRFHDDANGSISWRSLTKSKESALN